MRTNNVSLGPLRKPMSGSMTSKMFSFGPQIPMADIPQMLVM